MAILKGLEPERVWYYFEEISKIPRCSGNENGIRDFIKNFAILHKLEYKIDQVGNIVVISKPSIGYEDKDVIVLQAHMDMVCEKNRNVAHDFERDPIKLKVEGQWVKADGTTLGADNGMGMAAMLALLEDEKLNHGIIECLFTVEEETGLKGAIGLGENMITGRYMINLDSEDADTIYIGCAGGVESKIFLDTEIAKVENKNFKFYRIIITGLKGGHSGGDINKERANSLKLMARLLFKLNINDESLRLVSIKGGDKHNAIPRECFSVVASLFNENEIKEIVKNFEDFINDEYKNIESGIEIKVSEETAKDTTLSDELTNKIICLMMSIPHGVIKMSKIFNDLVETSTNFASISVDTSNVEFYMSHRSLVESSLEALMDNHFALSKLVKGEISFQNRYPAWQPDTNSKLLELSSSAFKDICGKNPMIKVIHAGLEAAIIKDKFDNMEIVSIGPTIVNPHSPEESVNIKTVALFWKTLIKIIEIINQ